ncbi:transposase [Niallia sp. 03091]|uniref:transposase n=1 Tax=Niallia sp. 03091 TaxID=3458059 RepID=UPI004043DE10
MEQLSVAVFIAVIVGVVELFKKSLGLPVRFAPLVSVLLGVLVGIFYLGVELKTGIVYGLIIGLSSCGLYSGVKSTTK